MPLEIVFWTLFATVAWCYFGYPAAMRLLARVRPAPPAPEGPPPGRVSVVLAVRDEAVRLPARLANLLEQEGADESLEIVVVCNGCSDGTEQVAAEAAREEPRIRVLVSPGAEGKSGALNRAAAQAAGDVLVFADARQTFDSDVLRRLASHFEDPRVAAVSGRLVIGESGVAAVAGVRGYWGYETRLRLAESATGSVVGVTGAIYALRREQFDPMPPNLILDDVWLPMRAVQMGGRVILDPLAIARDLPSTDHRSEFRRKVRTMVGNLQLVRLRPDLLIPGRNPILGRFISHKLLRLATPVCLLGMLVIGLSSGSPLYQGLALVQLAFYALGAVGLVLPSTLLAFPAAFLLVHAAVVVALFRFRKSADSVWHAAEQPRPATGGGS